MSRVLAPLRCAASASPPPPPNGSHFAISSPIALQIALADRRLQNARSLSLSLSQSASGRVRLAVAVARERHVWRAACGHVERALADGRQSAQPGRPAAARAARPRVQVLLSSSRSLLTAHCSMLTDH